MKPNNETFTFRDLGEMVDDPKKELNVRALLRNHLKGEGLIKDEGIRRAVTEYNLYEAYTTLRRRLLKPGLSDKNWYQLEKSKDKLAEVAKDRTCKN